MTREIKLALILGSALVLVVGVLISDHLSAARRTNIAHTTGDLATPVGLQTREFARVKDPNAQWEAEVAELPRHKVAEEPKAVPAPPVRTPVDYALGNPDAALIADAGRQGVVLEGLTRMDFVSPTGLGGSADETLNPSPATPVREHVVREGDTLWSIAQRHYGDGRQHIRIADANRDVIASGRSLDIGMRLRLPALDAPAGAAGFAAATPPKEARPSKYVVKSGDTLVAVARKTLGSDRRWEEILALNSEKISDPDSLTVGAELRIPQR